MEERYDAPVIVTSEWKERKRLIVKKKETVIASWEGDKERWKKTPKR